MIERRHFGPDGLLLSRLGFGCGAVGGLMVRGTSADQERAIARALEVGINYFDTAPDYGDGASEKSPRRHPGKASAGGRRGRHQGTPRRGGSRPDRRSRGGVTRRQLAPVGA